MEVKPGPMWPITAAQPLEKPQAQERCRDSHSHDLRYCRRQTDARRGAQSVTAAPLTQPASASLIRRYDQRLPRYTSYPTAPHFTPAVGPETHAAWLGALPSAEPLSLYLHVPFCAELCLYCGCHTTVVRRYAPVAAYVRLVEKEIALAARHAGEGRPAVHIHWGGGTPTMLSAADLLEIMHAVRAHFDVQRDAEVAIEIDPRTLTRERVEALAAVGVNRASIGVQDLNEKVQRAVHRVQTYEETARAAAWLRAIGVSSLSIDLMYGLPHQSVQSLVESVREALRLDPDRIALFGYAHVPWMKRHQALLEAHGLPDTLERFDQAQAAAAAIVEAGYVAIGLDHFAKPEDALARVQREGRLRRNFQGYTADPARTLIGFGTSSISRLPEGYAQNASSTAAYRAAIEARRLATARGVALTAEDRFRGAIIERLMCDLCVDLERVAAAHGEDPHSLLPELARIDALAEDGLVARQGFRLTVPDAARPFLRSVCAVFDRYLAPGETRHSRAI